MNLEIIYKDEFIVCVSKPNNVVVHHTYHSRNIIEEQSLLEKIYDEFGEKMFPIHRLDRKTSGIILLVRNNKIVSSFQQLFLENKIKKTYLGIVRGHSPEKLVIDSRILRSIKMQKLFLRQ